MRAHLLLGTHQLPNKDTFLQYSRRDERIDALVSFSSKSICSVAKLPSKTLQTRVTSMQRGDEPGFDLVAYLRQRYVCRSEDTGIHLEFGAPRPAICMLMITLL
jgi:hypothetical protein